MSVRKAIILLSMLSAGFLAGCAGDGSNLISTASVPAAQKLAQAPAINPQCVGLLSQIAALRKEGTPERIKKVAAGKSATAQVKRSALAKLTELDAANVAFQQKCSTLTPAQRASLAAQAASTTSAASKVTAVAKTKAQVTSAVSNVAAKADKAASVAKAAKTVATTAVATRPAAAQ